jgi:hypothetical protein
LFDKEEEDGNQVTCKICNLKIQTEDDNTGSLWHHLKNYHEPKFTQLRSNLKRKFEQMEQDKKIIKTESDPSSSNITSLQYDSSLDRSDLSLSSKLVKMESLFDGSDLSLNSKPLSFDMKRSHLSSSSEEEEDIKKSLTNFLARNSDKSYPTKKLIAPNR